MPSQDPEEMKKRYAKFLELLLAMHEEEEEQQQGAKLQDGHTEETLDKQDAQAHKVRTIVRFITG